MGVAILLGKQSESMRWLQLDLDNFTAISQEVDDVVARHKSIVIAEMNDPSNRGIAEAHAQLKYSIEKRIDDLEKFYYENDMDERAILFEKQRLKLRKVLTTEYDRGDLAVAASSHDEDTPEVNSAPRSRPISGAMKRHQARKASNTPLVHSSSVQGSKRVAPIYDWEVRGAPKAATEENSEERSQGFEFQVRLGPEEYEELMERRAAAGARGRSFLHKGGGKTMSTSRKSRASSPEDSGAFVTSQGPYIEPTYFENWRHVDKNKWVAKTDFTRTAAVPSNDKFDDGMQLSGFLQDGPYIENSFKTCLRHEEKDKWVAEEFRRF